MQLERLKEWRESQGFTQRELAGKAGVGEVTVARVETGASIRPNTARKIAGALGLEVSDLLARPPTLAEPTTFPKESAPSTPEVSDEERRELYSAADKFSADTTRGTPPIDFDDLVTLRERIQRLGDTHRALREQYEESGPLPVSDWAYELEAVTEKLWRDGVEAALEYGGLAPVKYGGVADAKEDWKAEQLRLREVFDTLVNLQEQAGHLASQKKAAAAYSKATMPRAAEAVLNSEAQRQKETR